MDFEDHSNLSSPIASNEGVPLVSMEDLHLFEQHLIANQLPPVSEEQIEEMFRMYIDMDACASPRFDMPSLMQ